MNDLKKLTADKIVWQAIRFSLIILILVVGYIAVTFVTLPPLIPLYNQRPWGITRLGNKFLFFLPLFVSTAVLIVNAYLAGKFQDKMPLIARIMAITALLCTLISAVFVFRITQLLA